MHTESDVNSEFKSPELQMDDEDRFYSPFHTQSQSEPDNALNDNTNDCESCTAERTGSQSSPTENMIPLTVSSPLPCLTDVARPILLSSETDELPLPPSDTNRQRRIMTPDVSVDSSPLKIYNTAVLQKSEPTKSLVRPEKPMVITTSICRKSAKKLWKPRFASSTQSPPSCRVVITDTSSDSSSDCEEIEGTRHSKLSKFSIKRRHHEIKAESEKKATISRRKTERRATPLSDQPSEPCRNESKKNKTKKRCGSPIFEWSGGLSTTASLPSTRNSPCQVHRCAPYHSESDQRLHTENKGISWSALSRASSFSRLSLENRAFRCGSSPQPNSYSPARDEGNTDWPIVIVLPMNPEVSTYRPGYHFEMQPKTMHPVIYPGRPTQVMDEHRSFHFPRLKV